MRYSRNNHLSHSIFTEWHRQLIPVDPTTAPTTFGNLKLRDDSPLIDQGDNAANDTLIDLAGADRFQNDIDLGAYEGGYAMNFSTLFPTLGRWDDDNGNGLNNYVDYATGADPRIFNPHVAPIIDGSSVTFHSRSFAYDAWPVYFKSNDLINWSRMESGADYSINQTSDDGYKTTTTIDLTFPPSTKTMYFRQEFQTGP